MATAIEFNNIGKLYRLGLVSTGTLKHDLRRWWTINVRRKEDPYLRIGETNDLRTSRAQRQAGLSTAEAQRSGRSHRSSKGESDYVWALKDIDFKVNQGDVVGIIGKNGAGKSTLLKILSRVTAPTTGTIRARGRIGSLLEVGTGFHPEMTGRENIYMNGAILGMTKAEISRKLDEIVDFSGCERYIDTPVKRYSSGMMVRLGFAVAAHLDPEILVVDEVLAVGDAEFQQKAIGKMQSVSHGEGRTVLFVSHNMTTVKNLCHNGIVLDNGRIAFNGNINDVIDFYLNGQTERSKIKISDIHDRQGNRSIFFTNIRCYDSKGLERDTFRVGESVTIELSIDTDKRFDICHRSRVDIGINNNMGERIVWLSTYVFSDKVKINNGIILFHIPHLILQQGTYNVNLFSTVDDCVADWVQNVAKLQVESFDYYNTGRDIPVDQGQFIMDFSIQ